MTGEHYRGIRYSVTEPVRGLWKWEIHPPDCVKGWSRASGELQGRREDAIAAARQHIEKQDCANERAMR